ncbi:DNA-directed RNA polymerase II subunit RPB11-a-like [Teleopsis dalmanni]|uniref:DNA-directed RNA polymerase II subunit RPB11-a-like n=1 Tax=Teleopsis dalmanni TaxID=139649 RepID=UPI0018CE5B2C|nr:DNA-directed RNA polymerase II subunit RPB11-a-like [Teleopsis dalmanni]
MEDKLPNYEKYLLPKGEPKITVTQDEKMPNCYVVVIKREDSTVLETIKTELMKNDNVLFCGYHVYHPEDYEVTLRVMTNGVQTCKEVCQIAFQNIRDELQNLHQELIKAISMKKVELGQADTDRNNNNRYYFHYMQKLLVEKEEREKAKQKADQKCMLEEGKMLLFDTKPYTKFK